MRFEVIWNCNTQPHLIRIFDLILNLFLNRNLHLNCIYLLLTPFKN